VVLGVRTAADVRNAVASRILIAVCPDYVDRKYNPGILSSRQVSTGL
jgi:hypothetical protein